MSQNRISEGDTTPNAPPERGPVDFIPVFRTYKDRETGAESGLITDLASLRGKVTLNHGYNGRVEEIRQGSTLFREITITPPLIPESIRNLIRFGDALASNDVSTIANAIASVIERRWDPKQFHLVMHSSGYDSRIISKTIANLREKHGGSWLGDVLFLCWEPEGALFKQIMELEGWRREQYHVCNEDAAPGEYYAGVLDFNNCWKWTNDAGAPIWISVPTILQLRESGVITKPLTETQCINGGVGNECFIFAPDRLVQHEYYSCGNIRGAFIPFSELILPFASYDVLRLVKLDVRGIDSLSLRYNKWVDKGKTYSSMLGLLRPPLRWVFRKLRLVRPPLKQRMREELLSYLSPELLMITRGDDGPTAPQRRLSERLRSKCLEDFTRSWYYRNVILPHFPEFEVDVPSNIWLDDWWTQYAKASICDYLVKSGVEVIASD